MKPKITEEIREYRRWVAAQGGKKRAEKYTGTAAAKDQAKIAIATRWEAYYEGRPDRIALREKRKAAARARAQKK